MHRMVSDRMVHLRRGMEYITRTVGKPDVPYPVFLRVERL